MPALKHSKQREAILRFLSCRSDHPTADTVYLNIRKQFPNISLRTVYRNLSLLAELGEIQKISTGSGADRFDGNTAPHYHFVCRDCGAVSDMDIYPHPLFQDPSEIPFSGKIDGHVTYFYGRCQECLRQKAAGDK